MKVKLPIHTQAKSKPNIVLLAYLLAAGSAASGRIRKGGLSFAKTG